MPALINTNPPAIALSQEPIIVELIETDLIDSTLSTIEFIIASGAIYGEDITLAWNGVEVTMTAAEEVGFDPNSFLGTVDGTVATTVLAYAQLVMEHFLRNEIISGAWGITLDDSGPSPIMLLTAKAYGYTDVGVTGTLSNITVTAYETTVYLEDNLQATLKLIQEDYTGTTTDVITLNASYNPATKLAQFNLQDLLDLSPFLPDPTSILNGGLGADQAYTAYRKYHFRYANRYGTAPVAEALIKSGDFYMIRGGFAGDGLRNFPPDADTFLCHDYTFTKKVNKHQPDWVYLFTKEDLASRKIRIKITWSDGSTTWKQLSNTLNLAADKMHVLPSGFWQMGLNLEVNDELEIVGYEWRLTTDAEEETYDVRVLYEVDSRGCHPWNIYLLFFNGLGGCETAWFKGKTAYSQEAKRDFFQVKRWNNVDVAEGELIQYNSSGQQVIEANSGWHSEAYINHLRQVLIGECWIVDTANSRFIRYNVDSTSMKMKEDDEQLFSLQIVLKLATFDTHYHTK